MPAVFGAEPLGDVPGAADWPAEADRALEMMMDAFGTMVLRLAFFYLRDRHWAEDASQEVFVRAFRGWPAFRGMSSVKTWLARITVNVCRGELRRRRWREVPAADPGEPPGRDSDPEEAAIARLERGRVLGSIMALPPDLRETVFLYYYFGLGTAEIARILDCPEGTVRSRLHRGRDRIKAVLGREGWCDGR